MKTTEKTKIILYGLPFAGGNSLSFRGLQAHLVDTIQMKAIDLPGHGKRVRETLLTHLETIVDDIFSQIQPELDKHPYAIYGHSLGAALGHLLIRRIVNQNLSTPMHFFVSGRRAPSVKQTTPFRHCLPKAEFISMLRKLGGSPPELLEHDELIDFFEPILRADFQALETHEYHQTHPFNIPLTILHGMNDKEVSYHDLLPWQQETTQPISIKQFSGDHFFIFQHFFQIGQLFSQILPKKVI